MKIIKKVILVLVILVVVITTLLYFYNKYKNKDLTQIPEADSEFEDEEGVNEYKDSFIPIKDKNYYFVVKNIVSKYISNVQQVNKDMGKGNLRDGQSEEEIANEQYKQGIEYFNSVLDDNYKKEFNVNEQTIVNKAGRFKKDGMVYYANIKAVYNYEIENGEMAFIVLAGVQDVEFKLIVKLDFENEAYSIFEEDYINKHPNNNYDLPTDKIEKNDNNGFEFNIVGDKEMIREYFTMQKYNIMYDAKREYNLLDDEYKKKKFKDSSDFENYANLIKNDIQDTTIEKYKVDIGEDYYRYYFLDNKGRYYTIEKTDEIFNYKVKLDDYTIETQEFKEYYKNANDKNKALTDIEKFIKMLNNKDYGLAYELLNKNFRASNFATLEDFKKYVQNNFFNYNILPSNVDISKEGTYYNCSVELKESNEANSRSIKKNFIVSLKEGTDFEMSFNVN